MKSSLVLKSFKKFGNPEIKDDCIVLYDKNNEFYFNLNDPRAIILSQKSRTGSYDYATFFETIKSFETFKQFN